MSVIEDESALEDAMPGEEPERPLTSLEDFPHEKVARLWNARIDYAHDATEENRKEYAEAKAWYENAVWDWQGADKVVSPQLRVSVNTWHRTINILLSYLASNDPRVLLAANKGEEFEATARAAAKLAQYTMREMNYKGEVRKAIVEALLRNRSYLCQEWDSYQWLPALRHCTDEVYLDPDAGGDMANARWISERYTARLDDLLADPEIPSELKEELRGATAAHIASRPGRTGAEALRSGEDKKTWDDQPGFTKVVAYRVFSADGLLPGRVKDANEYSPTDSEPAWLAEYRSTTDRPGDEAPAPQGAPDPVDKAGRRVKFLLVKGFNKVLKVGPWPMDHYGRNELPYLRLQFDYVPDNADGVTMFKVLAPLYKAKNGILSFAFADARFGAQRRLGVDRSVVTEDVDVEKITNGAHLEAFDKRGGQSAVEVVEFTARNPQQLNLLPEIDRELDSNSGVNDAIRGETGGVEKTKGEAMMLHDSAQAALAYLNDPLNDLHEQIARYTVMAEQRYIRRETLWEPCPECGQTCPECEGAGCDECVKKGRVRGSGLVPDMAPVPGSLTLAPAMKPCPTCASLATPTPVSPAAPPAAMPEPGAPVPPSPSPSPVEAGAMPVPPVVPGSGWHPEAKRGAPLRKGADWWLSKKDADAWRDDLSIEQIRAEVTVSIEPGSTRRDYRERRVGLLSQLLDRFGPRYQEAGYFRSLRALDREVVLATELPNAEAFLPTDQEFNAATQQMQAMKQAQMQPPGPPPEQVQAQQEAAQQEAAARQEEMQRKLALEEMKAQAEVERAQAEVAAKQALAPAQQAAEERRLAIEERRVLIEEARVRAEIAAQQAPVAPSPLDMARADGERAKIAHEERRLAIEEAGANDAAQKFGAIVARAQGVNEQINATLSQVVDAIKVLAGVSQKLTADASENRAMHDRTARGIADLAEIFRAPIKVERDASGKVTGAHRVAPTDGAAGG